MGKFSGGIRMAKASFEDLAAAMDLALIVDTIHRGGYPTSSEEDAATAPSHFDEYNQDHQLHLYRLLEGIAERGGLWRVVMGMDTILRSDILDPDADHLALHPKFAAAENTLRSALADLVGSSDPEQLRGIHNALLQLPAPDEDKAAMLNAINVLIATAPPAEVAHG